MNLYFMHEKVFLRAYNFKLSPIMNVGHMVFHHKCCKKSFSTNMANMRQNFVMNLLFMPVHKSCSLSSIISIKITFEYKDFFHFGYYHGSIFTLSLAQCVKFVLNKNSMPEQMNCNYNIWNMGGLRKLSITIPYGRFLKSNFLVDLDGIRAWDPQIKSWKLYY